MSSPTEHLQWFPMRVTYNRELPVKAQLDLLGIENFLPMKYGWVDREHGHGKKRQLVPAVHNLIFVRSSQVVLTELKMTRQALLPLRYMMRHSLDGESHSIIRVPDDQMNNFLAVASVTDDRVMFLGADDFVGKEGKRVRIMGGDFEGVEGVIKRVKRCKRVVVQIEGVLGVAIAYVPGSMLEEI